MSTTQGFGNTGAWWGPLPHTWRCLPLKRAVANIIQRAGTPTPFMALEFIEPGLGRPVAGFDWAEEKGGEEYTAFKPGDVLFGKLRPYLAKSILADRGGCCATELLVLRPNKALMVPAYHWWLTLSRPFVAMAETTSYGTKMPRTSWQALSPRAVPSPPLSVQRTIAALLDRETAKIDALVAKKERLIELLQEKRSALISHVVTRGLDPTAPMKESGIRWVGPIPSHWAIRRFHDVIDFREGPGILAKDFVLDGTPLLRIRNLHRDPVDLDGCNYVDPEMVLRHWSHMRVKTGDILISGSASMDGVSEVGDGAEGAIPYTGIIRLRPRAPELAKDYIKIWVMSRAFMEQVNFLKAGATIQHYGPTHLRSTILPLPPVGEQGEIISWLAGRTARIDALVGKVREVIEKLKECRAALITAAVTGKIDVRDGPELPTE